MVNDSVTLVAAKGDMLVGGNDVSVEGIFGSGEFSFNLEKPVRIGSVMSITYWLKDVYNLEGAGVDVITIPAVAKTEADFLTIIRDAKGNTDKRDTLIAAIKKNLIDNGIPEPAQALMTSALLAEVSVDALKIDFRKEEKDKDDPQKVTVQGKETVIFGMSVSAELAPLQILPGIALKKVALGIVHAKKGADEIAGFKKSPFTFLEDLRKNRDIDAAVQAVNNKLALPDTVSTGKAAEGSISFAAVPTDTTTLTLNTIPFAFSDSALKALIVADDVAATVKKLATHLTGVAQAKIQECSYTADGTTLKIVCKKVGAAGNGWPIVIDPTAGIATIEALKGGVDAPAS